MDSAKILELFFDRSSLMLPHYVSQVPALKISIVISLVVFIAGVKAVLDDKRDNLSSESPVKRFRWVVMLSILLAVCAQLQDFLRDRIYMAANIKANSQHFANVWWLRKYSESIKGA